MHHGVPYLRDSQSVNVKGNAHLPGPGLSPHQMTHDDYTSITSLDLKLLLVDLLYAYLRICVSVLFFVVRFSFLFMQKSLLV